MSDRLKELREKRGRLVGESRALLEKAKAEKRELTAEEAAKYDEMFAEQEKVAKTIVAEERQADLDREAAAAKLKEEEERKRKTGDDPAKEKRAGVRSTPEYRAAFQSFLSGGINVLTDDETRVYRQAIAEARALQAGSGPEGGYMVAPEAFINELIKFVDNLVFVRRLARKLPVTQAQSLGVPTLSADPDDADWTSELGTGSEDSTMAFGKRKMVPHPLAKRIKVSNELLRITAGTAESLVMERLGYKFGVTEEKAFLTGNGVERPLGVFTASNDGIPTSRDISTDNTSTAITFDGLINAKYGLKPQYRGSARWLFHRDAVKMISKLKDGDGQYLWRQSVREGEPDTILNLPYDESEYAPNTFTTGLYVGLLANWQHYWIADSMMMTVQRLTELYAETNQVGFIGRLQTDGAPVLAEAFVRVKLA